MATTLDRRKAHEIVQAVALARRRADAGETGGTILSDPSGTPGNASLLAAANRMDRELVDAGTAFGKKHRMDTGFGIMFGDTRRFNKIDKDVKLGRAPAKVTRAERERALLMLSDLQSLHGKPMGITDAMSPRKSSTSQHMIGNAFDTSVPGGMPEKAEVVEAAAQLGFGGIGASYANSPKMVHVDTRSMGRHGPAQWGPDRQFSSAPPWQRKAIARGFGKAPDWDAVAAANARSPLGLAEALAAMKSR